MHAAADTQYVVLFWVSQYVGGQPAPSATDTEGRRVSEDDRQREILAWLSVNLFCDSQGLSGPQCSPCCWDWQPSTPTHTPNHTLTHINIALPLHARAQKSRYINMYTNLGLHTSSIHILMHTPTAHSAQMSIKKYIQRFLPNTTVPRQE